MYFSVVYENEEMTHTMIQSWEYLGKGEEDGIYRFRPLNPFAVGDAKPTPYDGEFELNEKNMNSLLDLSGLIDHLQRLQAQRTWPHMGTLMPPNNALEETAFQHRYAALRSSDAAPQRER